MKPFEFIQQFESHKEEIDMAETSLKDIKEDRESTLKTIERLKANLRRLDRDEVMLTKKLDNSSKFVTQFSGKYEACVRYISSIKETRQLDNEIEKLQKRSTQWRKF